MRNRGLKYTKNDYVKYRLLRYFQYSTIESDFIINNEPASESSSKNIDHRP